MGAYFERAKLGRMSRESAGTFQLGSLSFSMGGVMLILSQEWFPQKKQLKTIKSGWSTEQKLDGLYESNSKPSPFYHFQ